ncbi:MAG: 4Fe-4S dicluster domain-containing protein [Deltaproteobacteria bacterium]|nr:MAG: 4Fe-4S dicluster domain-containing protein [Deltaproteobacteria bacterium]
MKGFEYLRNVATLRLDQDTCIGCGLCCHVCPHQVFVMDGKKARIALDACMECGACSLNCPVKAIAVDSGVGCASGMINEWLQSISPRFRKSGGGC